MSFDFTLRIYNTERSNPTEWYEEITISKITFLVKKDKFMFPEKVKLNENKFGYKVWYNFKQMYRTGGTNSFPAICFKGKYIDFKFKNFPRYPCFCQGRREAFESIEGAHEGKEPQGYFWRENEIEILNLKHSEKQK